MASTGNVFPVTGENLDRSGATDWVTPGNIVSDNATDATCASGASGSDYLIARNFGFTLPTDAVIGGITVRVEASEHTAGTEVVSAQLQNDLAALIGAAKTATVNGTAKSIYTYGSTTDTWSASPTPAMVNDPDFGVRIWFTTTHDVRIDFVTLAIEYTEPRRAQVSFAEFEVPNAPRRAQISFAEMEVPDAPTRRAQISWAELEVPTAPRRAQVSWAEFEVPTAPRRAQVSWAEFEVPSVAGGAATPLRTMMGVGL